MIRVFIIAFIMTTSCGKKGDLYIDGQKRENSSIIYEERNYKF